MQVPPNPPADAAESDASAGPHQPERRQTNLSEQRAHLDLQINLLTEQKVTKLIRMLEALRRDLPVPRQASDAHTSALKEGINATQVASVLKHSELGAQDGPARSPRAR